MYKASFLECACQGLGAVLPALRCAHVPVCQSVYRQTRGARSGCLGSSTLARYGSCRSTTWCGPPAVLCREYLCWYWTPGFVSVDWYGALCLCCVQLVSYARRISRVVGQQVVNLIGVPSAGGTGSSYDGAGPVPGQRAGLDARQRVPGGLFVLQPPRTVRGACARPRSGLPCSSQQLPALLQCPVVCSVLGESAP